MMPHIEVMVPFPVLICYAAVMGLLLGSFLNVCITRWPAEQSVVRPRSRCPRCGNLIAWYDNIPVVSWVWLRARCRRCALPIPAMYPLVELATAAIWVWAAWQYGATIEMLRAAVFVTILLGIAMTDAREFIIPDEFSVGGAVAGLLFALLGGALAPLDALIGAILGLGLLWIIAWAAEKLMGQEAMGGGDIKMMAMVGAFLGWSGVLLTLFLGALLGTLIFLPVKLAGREPKVPFGIFLAIGALACWLTGDQLLTWYQTTMLGVAP